MGRSGRRAGSRRNLLLLAMDENEFLADLAMATLAREGLVEEIVPPARPTHIYAQQVMALAWLGLTSIDGLVRLSRKCPRPTEWRYCGT